MAARVKLSFEKPAVGQLLSRLVPVDASRWCETVATDGRHLFYNRDFIGGVPKRELVALLADLIVADPTTEGSDLSSPRGSASKAAAPDAR